VRVLLDENLPHTLRKHLLHHDTEAGFDVLVTGDKTLQYEQNLAIQGIGIVLLSANAWRVIKSHVAGVAAAVDEAQVLSRTSNSRHE
jgi:hypothetical protein